MCQILGMNCRAPTDFSFSLKGFCRRGGATDKHSHGFGLCVYEGRGVRSFHDTLPACKSPIAELVQNYPIRTYSMMAHIRYATQGEVSLENVHPFVRVWKGIQMSFCHNGDCPKFNIMTTKDDHAVPLLGKTRPCDRIYHPVGDTDSEAVFCAILNALTAEFPGALPTLSVLHEFLSVLCDEIVADHPADTIFNFLLGCGQYTLFAYSWPGKRPGSDVWNGLHYLVRQPPFTKAKLLDADYTIDFAQHTTNADRVAVITTKPLTEEPGWVEFKRGELLMFDKGLPYRTPKCCEQVERAGRGLYSRSFSTAKKCTQSPTVLSVRSRPPSPPQLDEAMLPVAAVASAVATAAAASSAAGRRCSRSSTSSTTSTTDEDTVENETETTTTTTATTVASFSSPGSRLPTIAQSPVVVKTVQSVLSAGTGGGAGSDMEQQTDPMATLLGSLQQVTI